MHKHGTRATIVLAILLVAFSAVASGHATERAVRIGVPLPLTGPLASEGLKQKRGYDLWAEAVNRAGGIVVSGERHKVDLVYNDYQSTTPRAVRLAEKLVTDDKVHFLFAPFGSGATKATSAIAEKYRVPMIAPTASSEEVFDQGYKYLFGILQPNRVLAESLAEIVRHKLPSANSLALLARNDLFPLAMAQDAARTATGRGFEVVIFDRYAVGTMDHASALTQIRAAKPDWILATGYTADLILIRRQMASLRVAAPVMSVIIGYKEFVDATGPLAENVTSATWWHPAVRYKGTDVFGTTENYNKAFEAKYNMLPDFGGAEAAASVAGVVLQLAIERAGSLDPKIVREVLASSQFSTFYGPIRFGPTGQVTALEAVVVQIQDGEPVVLAPAAIKQGELRLGVK